MVRARALFSRFVSRSVARCLVVPVAAFACGAVACGPTAAPIANGPANVGPAQSTPVHAQIAPTDDDPGGTKHEVFERAKLAMGAGKLAFARTLFDRVVEADRAELLDGAPPSELGRAARYNAALCSEELAEPLDARDRFRALAAAAPATADALDAELRRARLDVELEDWIDLGLATTTLLGRKDLGRYDRAEAQALRALSQLHGAKDLAEAEKTLVASRKLFEQKDSPDEIAPPHNAAAVHFARGDLLRARGLAMTFVDRDDPEKPVVIADFPDKMEARCQSILDAQDAYVESINTHDARWAVRSGLRVASMYVALHDDLLAIPPPKSATNDAKKALFRGAMRLRYRILLEKGLGTLDRTLNLEKAVGAKTTWLDHAREAKADLEKKLEDEKAEIAKLPYTEADLQKALDDLSGKPAGKKS